MVEYPKLGPTDLALIRLLQKDARQTNKDLADSVGIAQSTCHERIRSLRERGVIRGWHADVDPAAVGRPVNALVSIRLQPKTTTSVRAFRQDLLQAPETRAVWMVAGPDDFVVEIAVPDVSRLRDFVLESVTSRTDVVDARTALVYEKMSTPYLEPM